jgi:uncharacterized membrane protein
MARTLRGEHFDSSSLNELNARHDALLEEVRRSLQTSLSQLHEALDPQQRRQLADMLEHGWGYGWRGGSGGCGWRGGYRSC